MDIETRNIKVTRNIQWLFLLVAALGLAFGRSWVDLWPFVTVLAAGAALNALSYAAPGVTGEGAGRRFLYPLLLVVDLSVIALATGFSGGVESPLFAFLLVLLLVPAFSGTVALVASMSAYSVAAFVTCAALLGSAGLTASASTFIKIALLAAFPMVFHLALSGYRRRLRDGETFSTLYRISRSLGESLDLKQVLHLLLEEVDSIFHTDISSVRLLNPGTNTLAVRASGADSEEIVDEQIEIRMGEGFIGWVAKTGEPFLINDISKHPSFSSFPKATKKVSSAIATPIKIGDRVVGVVSCASSRRKRFSEEDLDLLSSVASLAGAAIERAELYQQLLSRGEAVIERMVDGLIVVDRDGHAVLTNKTSRDMLDIRPGIGALLEDLMKGRIVEWRTFTRDVKDRMLDPVAGPPSPFSTELNVNDPQATVLNAKVSPIMSQWNKVIGAAILLENITAIVRLTRELAVEKRKLETVLENVVAGVLAVNDEGEILLANSAAFHILGIERPWWWLGSPLADAIPEPDLCRMIRDAIERGEEVARQTAVLASGRQLELSCVPLTDFTPGHGATVAVLHDVTEIHQLEQAKGDFVSMVSHELRTPLTSIKAYIDTLQREDVEFPPETRASFIRVIAREAERMIRLINDILDLSRIEAGRLELKPTFVDLIELTGRVVNRVQSQADVHKIILDVPVIMEPVIAEGAKIEQVLLNLIGNAIKYSPEGGKILVSVRRLKEKAMVSVSDNGMGIPPDQLPYIFDKYHRVNQANAKNVLGAGLGLYVTKSIVEAHGGRIWAESEVGKGTTVIFTVPLASEGGALDPGMEKGDG